MNQYQIARAKEKQEAPKKALENLFVDPPPPKPQGVKQVATKLDELQKQIEELTKQKEALVEKEKSAAIEDINEKIKLFGLRTRDLDFGDFHRFDPKAKAKVPVKYKKGHDTWSGRGRKPKWVEDHITGGGKMDELLVK